MDWALGTDITVLLRAWSGGDRQAFEKLIPLVYRKLYSAAQWYMAQQAPGHILQNSALVNETYLRLVNLEGIDWQDRNHFYAVCAQLMRRILASYVRTQLSLKRGGTLQHVSFDEAMVPDSVWHADLVTIDEALDDLAAFDERMLRIVELRALVGLTVQETAAALKISERTVDREWRMAKAWLMRELSRGKTNGH